MYVLEDDKKKMKLAKNLYASSKLCKSKMAGFRCNEYQQQISMLAVKNQRYLADGAHYK